MAVFDQASLVQRLQLIREDEAKDVITKINKITQQQKTLEKEVEKFKGLSKDREIPLILKFLGEFLHAGKATTFGLGKYEVM